MNLKSIFVFLNILIMFQYGKSQTLNFTESQVLEKYNAPKSDNIYEVKKLYLYSKKKNYKQGTLYGLLKFQKHYLVNGNHTLSLKFSNLAEPIALKLNDHDALSSIYLYRGQTSAILDLYKEAKENLHKSVLHGNKISDKAEKSLQLSTIYANFAGMYEGDENTNDSISYYLKKSLETVQATPTDKLTDLQKTNYYSLLMAGYTNMGMLYTYILQPPRLDKAEPYFEKTLELSKTAPEYFESSDFETYKAVGVFYSRKKDYKKSIDVFNKALQIEKHKNNPRMRLVIYKELKDCYDSLKNIPKQNQYLKLYSSLNDSINRVDKKSIVQESRDRIVKTAEITKQDHNKNIKKILLLSFAVGIVILIAMWILFYKRSRKIKNNYNLLVEQLRQEDEDNLIKSQINILADNNNQTHSKILISDYTEKKILKKLLAFEGSEKFLKKDINLTYLSHQINTNPKYLSEIIRVHKNNNFNGYINNLRINYIVQKLYDDIKYREYKISYLAEESGYTSSQVFVIAFKKETGVTPSYFIENLKNDQLNIV